MSPKIIYNSTPYLVLEFINFYVFLPFIANRYLDGWLKLGYPIVHQFVSLDQ